ncbi:MAG: endolytic transglycosylase MltG [Deltaproteobacteria bacterium]|nr:MAG: endolytic transglycosylase MltG [Deltaproteobacteria bacterium]
MIRISRKTFVLSIIGVFFIVVVFLGLGLFLISPAKKGAEKETFVVRKGMALREVATGLEKRELIRSKEFFLLWARFKGYGKHIKAGEYSLGAYMSPVEILEKLHRGIIITHPVTIPEGYTIAQIAQLLDDKGVVKKEVFLSLARDPAVLKRYGIPGPSLEGYLYPDTYRFGSGVSAEVVVDTMVRRFFQVVRPLKARMSELGLSMKQVITLASIVEKETSRPEERPTIASVFLNRLKRGMRLESDPTVIYGIKNFNGNLTRKDLARKTPYNTYAIRGLPPGPIANPGLESIRAVVYPAKTDYLYFVSKNDGSHHFSRTLAEHNRAVQIYQKRRKGRHPKTS